MIPNLTISLYIIFFLKWFNNHQLTNVFEHFSKLEVDPSIESCTFYGTSPDALEYGLGWVWENVAVWGSRKKIARWNQIAIAIPETNKRVLAVTVSAKRKLVVLRKHQF